MYNSLIKKLSLLILLHFSLGILAVGYVPPYFAVSHIRRGKDLNFPVLAAHQNTRVNTKINRFLQLSELRSLADPKMQHVFEQATINDGSIYGRKVSLFYQIYANNSKTLSIGFNNSTDGATTHWWNSYYNFNAQNGDLVSLQDLFTEPGYRSFVELVVRKRSNAYRIEVRRKVSPDDQEAFFGVLGSIEHDDLSDFALGDRSITIDGENLLGKSLCCEGLSMTVRFRLREFQPWLNEYGRIVFGVQKGNLRNFRSDRLPQLFEGTVDGRSPFVGIINVDGNGQVDGVYAYLKYRKGIVLTGTMKDNNIQMTEHVLVKTPMRWEIDSDHRFVDGGTISGSFNGLELNGTWTNKSDESRKVFVASRN